MERYILNVVHVQLSGEPVSIDKRHFVDTEFHDSHLRGVIGSPNYGFWLELTNTSDMPIRLLWPHARYIDELGAAHEVHQQPRGSGFPWPTEMKPGPVVTVRPGEQVRPTIFPIYKSRVVASGCRDVEAFRERLVPTRIDDKDELQTKAYVDRLYCKQTPVKLLLPIEIKGTRHDYVFSFVLKENGPRRTTPPHPAAVRSSHRIREHSLRESGVALPEDAEERRRFVAAYEARMTAPPPCPPQHPFEPEPPPEPPSTAAAASSSSPSHGSVTEE